MKECGLCCEQPFDCRIVAKKSVEGSMVRLEWHGAVLERRVQSRVKSGFL